MIALAPLSMNARQVNDTPFTFRFSKFIVCPMRLHQGGFPSSAPLRPSPETRRIDGPVSSQRQKPTRCRPRLLRRRMRSMQFAARCTLRTGLSGRTRRLSRGMLAPLRVKLANCPLNQLALHNIGIEFTLRRGRPSSGPDDTYQPDSRCGLWMRSKSAVADSRQMKGVCTSAKTIRCKKTGIVGNPRRTFGSQLKMTVLR